MPAADEIKRLSADSRVDIEERAAIMEFDGGLTRSAAEEAALEIWRREQWQKQHPTSMREARLG